MLTFDPLNKFSATSAVLNWLIVMGILGTVAAVVCFAVSMVSYGSQGPRVFSRRLGSFFGDWMGTSFRRIGAVARLTWYEASRRKALYVFVIFGLLYLFAGWFTTNVGTDADMALKVYVGFVLRTLTWLTLPVVLILACWGLPEDIRQRSIHTVVTKPIRRHEIVLGRIAGYWAIGLFVLSLASVVGYFWIVRQLPAAAAAQLEAKVPIYGTLAFRDREGQITTAGVNVGDENMFRSFIDGPPTKARAIWDFSNSDWQQWKDRDELTVGGQIASGDQFVMTLDGAKLTVTAKSSNPAEVAAEIAEAWSKADASTHKPFTEVAAVHSSGNTISLTPKTPAAKLAVATAVVPKSGDKVVQSVFHTAPIKLESNFQAFRTWKGNIEQGLRCQFLVSKEYGILTLPPKVPQGTLKLGKSYTVKLPAGDSRTAADAIVAALAKANPTTHLDYARLVPELWTPKDASEGEGARLILRSPPNDLLPTMEVSGVPGVTYQFARMEAATSPFEIREFRRNEYLLPRAVTGVDGKVLDLYRDILDGDRLRVEARCLSSAQLLGMARPDLIVRLPSRTFLETYFKACLSIALLMGVIAVLGVCASTFVKGPIALILTFFVLYAGTEARPFIDFLSKGDKTGGGAIEGTYRIITHLNPATPVADTPAMLIVRALDKPFEGIVQLLKYTVPDFRIFSLDEFVAKAFDIPWGLAILPCVLMAIGIAVPWIVVAHFAMLVRELEHK